MTNLIAALIFIIISIFMIGTDATIIRHNANNSNLTANIIIDAKELQEFANAAFKYSESFNVPLSTTSLTVSNLQSYGLLPSTFPQTTPFGQSFTATYATDTCNQDVMDLEVATTGNYNTDLLAKNGLTDATLNTNYINSQVDNKLSNLNLNFANAHNPCITDGQSFYVGYTQAKSNIINLYGGGNITTAETADNNNAVIYIYAPNQWGYFSFTISNSIMGEWGSTQGTNTSVNGGANLLSYPGLSSSGWNLSCPTGSTIISPGSTYSQNYNLATNNIFYTDGFCIPAYKSQVNSLKIQGQSNLSQVFNISPESSFYSQFNIGGTDPANAYMYGGSAPVETGTVSYLNSISGLNNNIYGVESFF
ncbi:MAG: hypothetical protein ACYDEG_09810, partial [bacterium]